MMLRLIALAIVAFLATACSALDTGQFEVTPAAAGRQLVRLSVPWPNSVDGDTVLQVDANSSSANQWPAQLPASKQNRNVRIRCLRDGSETLASARVISWRSSESPTRHTPRRVMLTFEQLFHDLSPVVFQLVSVESVHEGSQTDDNNWPVGAEMQGQDVVIVFASGARMKCRLEAPALTAAAAGTEEIVEMNPHFLWKHIYYPDAQWPRWLEVRIDRSGTVVLVAHVQRVAQEDGFAPDFGWTVEGSWDDQWSIDHPLAKLHRRGKVEVTDGITKLHRYQRCAGADRVPMQAYAWQRVELVIAPTDSPKLPASLSSPHRFQFASEDLAALYPHWQAPQISSQPFAKIIEYHRRAIVASSVVGDDFGNVTSFNHGLPHGGNFGMNRLNHNAAIFEQAWRTGEPQLMEVALQWCDNFYDQSIWWGQPNFGGTRYNNVVAQQKTPLTKEFMWRSNDSVHFCTKGYDSFWLAWEETGDPRMLAALNAQVAYAAGNIHCDQGECRNVGDVRDFVRLYRMTGEQRYLDEALRLFRELRSKLSTEKLFDQGGKSLDPHPPFIDDDARGLTVGYAKPYIIGYALAGLPELLAVAPDEPQLKETIRAVADFLAETVDPAGGWRYPHPRSSLTLSNFGPEHAWHLCQACRALGSEPKWLDAIETVLRARILAWKKTGTILSTVEGWEISTGRVKDRLELQDLYVHPEDRPFERDWDEGRVSHGSAPPEGIVYFEEILDFYLQHRAADRLLTNPSSQQSLARILERL